MTKSFVKENTTVVPPSPDSSSSMDDYVEYRRLNLDGLLEPISRPANFRSCYGNDAIPSTSKQFVEAVDDIPGCSNIMLNPIESRKLLPANHQDYWNDDTDGGDTEPDRRLLNALAPDRMKEGMRQSLSNQVGNQLLDNNNGELSYPKIIRGLEEEIRYQAVCLRERQYKEECRRDRDLLDLHVNGLYLKVLFTLTTAASLVISFAVCYDHFFVRKRLPSTPCRVLDRWWESPVSYEIFPASFQDINEDGIGDIKGLIMRLDYVKELGVDVIRLNPIYHSKDYPVGYGKVLNFTELDSTLGSIDDFRKLVHVVHKKGMKLVLDLDPTMTSNRHPWAVKWMEQSDERYKYYYINNTQETGKTLADMNDRIRNRSEAYNKLAIEDNFLLNFSVDEVKMELVNTMDFWLKQGVDGFNMMNLEHIVYSNVSDILHLMYMWRDVLDQHSNTTRKIMIAPFETAVALYQLMSQHEMVETIFDVVDVHVDFSPDRTLEISDIVWRVQKWVSMSDVQPWLSWNFGYLNSRRLASRIQRENYLNCFFVLSVLPGTMNIFYGDEIGLIDAEPRYHIHKHVLQLRPMTWYSTPTGEFVYSERTKPWLPVLIMPNSGIRANYDQIEVLKKLIQFKSTTYQKTFFKYVRDTETRLPKCQRFTDAVQEPNYKWFHDIAKSLVSVEVSYGSDRKFHLFCNFGYSNIGLASLGAAATDSDGGTVELRKMSILVASDKQGSQQVVREVDLGPSEAILCKKSR